MLKTFKKDDIISTLSTKMTIKLYNENIKKQSKKIKLKIMKK